MTRLWSSVVVSLLAMTAGCSPVRIVEALLAGNDYTRNVDVPYGGDVRHRLDVYRPRESRGVLPVIVFLYGGRWQTGSRNQYHLLGGELTRRGFVAVVPDYRRSPQVKFPGWIEDAALAVSWTRTNIARFGGDSAQIWVVGHSAGAHSAVLLALDEHYLGDVGLQPGAVRGFVSLAGPVDTEWTDEDVQALMGPPNGWLATYPRTHIDGTEAPLLLLHGSRDRTVSPVNSSRLAERIRQRGGCAESILYLGVGHVEIVVALAIPRLGIAPVLNDLVQFIRDPRGRACRGK